VALVWDAVTSTESGVAHSQDSQKGMSSTL
jgi:hypothetical protein